MNYETMTVEELEKENKKLMEKRIEIKKEQLKLCAILSKKVDEKKIRAKIEAMTDKEKAVAVQVLSAEAVKSEEEVGTPGKK